MQINVSKPYLPDIKKYNAYLERIWKSSYLTNFGPLSQELESRLCEYLGVSHLLLVGNGTLALQIAFKVLGLKAGDEVITTPFSFVATTNTLAWEKLKISFCDIDDKSFCIDTSKISRLITPQTRAILPVHVFGNACDVKTLENIADSHKLKLIYDAAHAFGVKYGGKSIFTYGDIATISFHATKIFHSVEGGAIIFEDKNLLDEAKSMINFGLKENMPNILGINAKNSEFHAAMGLCVLDDIEYIMQERGRIWEYYYEKLKNYYALQDLSTNSTNNFHYFPILFETESSMLTVIKILNENKIFPRRYFYPSLDTLSFYHNLKQCPISQDIASRILCLPIYVGLSRKEQDMIIKHLVK
ncbi:aminotransferase DegT [Helicobacter didelphidarum]|uniref:Aminotransferase DegT n=1 Tax=Helicobacter didelphidarum TaxID=2040648 RepID=A0A3D8IEH4_9HELI|nr:DegT/DnrJ/EryC1/StrS family aminotransferase [Helicobacter didelphidarum]RDU63569.1 aminotransferase DegT [Helicobacter didelphidarum]